MSEQSPSSEIPHYSREQVIEAFRKFPEKGITSPDDLPDNDPEVTEANNILDTWAQQAQNEAKRQGTPEAGFEFELDRSTIFTDAGFEDPDYLDEVANDWLVQDLQRAEDAGLTGIASKIQAKMDQIQAKLS